VLAGAGELVPHSYPFLSRDGQTVDGMEHHLIFGPLWGPGRIEALEIFRPMRRVTDADTLCLVRLGDSLCGHREYIHGGLTSALLDNLFGHLFGRLHRENKLGKTQFTANLHVDYRRPMPKSTTFLIRLRVERLVDGRKGFLRAWVYDHAGNILVDSTSLYVVPRAAITRSKAKLLDYTHPESSA
jgi:acyl-coenzyme A thioesterase PaaI-like protein